MSDLSGSVEEDDFDFLDSVEGPSVAEREAPQSTISREKSEVPNSEDNGEGHERNIEEALSAKEEGNTYFREKYYHQALEMYSKAIDTCPIGEEFQEQMAIFYGNRAACYSALNDLDMVIADCTKSLNLNDKYIKVLMRRCQALESLERYDEAIIGEWKFRQK